MEDLAAANLEGQSFQADRHFRGARADFSAGHVSNDAGGLLLREVDLRLGLTLRTVKCFTDYQNADWVEHTNEQLARIQDQLVLPQAGTGECLEGHLLAGSRGTSRGPALGTRSGDVPWGRALLTPSRRRC